MATMGWRVVPNVVRLRITPATNNNHYDIGWLKYNRFMRTAALPGRLLFGSREIALKP